MLAVMVASGAHASLMFRAGFPGCGRMHDKTDRRPAKKGDGE
jgi:hypothetical protein